MVQKAASGLKEKELVGFVQDALGGNGQIQTYRWLHPRAAKRMHVEAQDTIRQLIKLFHQLANTMHFVEGNLCLYTASRIKV